MVGSHGSQRGRKKVEENAPEGVGIYRELRSVPGVSSSSSTQEMSTAKPVGDAAVGDGGGRGRGEMASALGRFEICNKVLLLFDNS